MPWWVILLGLAVVTRAMKSAGIGYTGTQASLVPPTTRSRSGSITRGDKTYNWRAEGVTGAISWRVEDAADPSVWAYGDVGTIDDAIRQINEQMARWSMSEATFMGL